MLTTKFGSNFSGDLNLHPRIRFYHRKSAEKEVAATWGFGIHRSFNINSIIAKYSHAINLLDSDGNILKTLEQSEFDAEDIVKRNADNTLYAETFLVFLLEVSTQQVEVKWGGLLEQKSPTHL